VLIGNKEAAQERHEAARAHPAFANIGSEPAIMLTGPSTSPRRCSRRPA
jgi:hypothetical protein